MKIESDHFTLNLSCFGALRGKSLLKNIFPAALFCTIAFFSGCSSAPKKPVEVFTTRIIAGNQLNLANQSASQGHYEDALLILEEARRLALSTDDPALRIKTSMSRGNILFSLGRHTEAFQEWETAAAEGSASGETVLAALARIYAIRAELVQLSNEKEPGDGDGAAAAEEIKTRLAVEMAAVKSDSSSTAVGNIVLGMAEKQMGRWTEAENAVKKALSFHEKNLNLEDAAYDWFLIASIRSVAGNYDSALEALKMAIRFDRRAENGFGLASSWQAMGDVYKKSGKAEESRDAYNRAAEIYRAINLNDLADQL